MSEKPRPILLLAVILCCTTSLYATTVISTHSDHFYLDAGISAYYLNNPNFSVAKKGQTNTPIATIHDDVTTPEYHLTMGYSFFNCSDSFWTRVFGHENAIELQAHYFNVNDKEKRGDLGQGQILFIDGSGVIWPVSLYPIAQIYDFHLKSQHRNTNIALYYKGTQTFFDKPNFTMQPYIGLVFDDLDSNYQFSTYYDPAIPPAPPQINKDTEHYDITTTYLGVAFGDRFNYSAFTRLTIFADIQIQILDADAKMKAEQYAVETPTPPGWYRKVHDSDNKLTYRATLAVGAAFHLTSKENSSTLNCKIGYDRWGYRPQIATPNKEKQLKTHIDQEATNNAFVDVELHVPFD